MSTRDFSGLLFVRDFQARINNPGLSADKSQIVIPYIGIANPALIASVSLTAYEFSMDNGTTWDTMSVTGDIIATTFTAVGNALSLVWDSKVQIGSLMYNNYIRIRIQAYNSANNLTADYANYILFFEKIVTTPASRQSTQFPPDYKGIHGSDLMKNAPKAVSV